MRNLRTSVHRLPLEPRRRYALQDNSDLPDLRQDAQRMPDMSPRPRIPPPDAGPRHRARRHERGADERHQSGVLRAEPGDQGAPRVERRSGGQAGNIDAFLHFANVCSLLGVRTS
jgi:hypothetical protein